MIICHLSNGLGNQILQYAVACGIAQMRGEEAVYDSTGFMLRKRFHHEVYALDAYPLRCRHASQKELFRIAGMLIPEMGWKGPKWLYVVLLRRVYLYADRFFHRKVWRQKHWYDITQTGTTALPKPGESSPGVMLVGCPFNIAYFQRIAAELREEFVPKKIEPRIAYIAKTMGDNAVCAHVRIRDDGSIPDPTYYERAIAAMSERVDSPQYYVFSNYAEHAKKVLRLPQNTIWIEPGDAVQDLYLMSRCHHHIIAESTYSWCGAWLGEKPGQIVMYPKGWEGENEPVKLVRDGWTPVKGMRYVAFQG